MSKDVRHYDVIVAPVITEKATFASELNKVVFKVRKDATKPQIKAAVEGLFDVKVEVVSVMPQPMPGADFGKTSTMRRTSSVDAGAPP